MTTQPYTDTQLKQALAKMLPERVEIDPVIQVFRYRFHGDCVLDTELLHLCWLVEEMLDKVGDLEEPPELRESQLSMYVAYLAGDCAMESDLIHATWQQRTIALAKVKGIEI